MPSHQAGIQWAGLSTVTPIDPSQCSRQGATLCLAVAMLSCAWLLGGAGTGMSMSAMTTWAFPPDPDVMGMPISWTVGYAALMLTMWSTTMWAMMLPALLLDAQRDRLLGPLSTAFVSNAWWLGWRSLSP